jgi:hypothetical protein
MRLLQRPVADLWIQGDAHSGAKNLGKIERPQYSCNFIKCVKALRRLQLKKIGNLLSLQKKAPEMNSGADEQEGYKGLNQG